MATIKVEVVLVESVMDHPGADRLELAQIKGWQCVIPKGQFKAGDCGVYFPIDCVIPSEVESKIFGSGSKVKLHNGRVKTIKLRGAISQGLLVPMDLLGLGGLIQIGHDLTQHLGVIKYEPPAPGFQSFKAGKARETNPHFHKYTSIENYKNHNKLFKPGDLVVVREKIHGTNFRAGWVPYVAKGRFRKLLGFFGMNPKWVFVVGSHNVERDPEDESLYSDIARRYGLKDKIPHGYVVYGEIYGDGIQKGYTYGCAPGAHRLVVFDVAKDGLYLNDAELRHFCRHKNLNPAPVLYDGVFSGCDLNALCQGPSELAPEQKVREGCVVKPKYEERCHIGRKILKVINPEYLLGDQTDFH